MSLNKSSLVVVGLVSVVVLFVLVGVLGYQVMMSRNLSPEARPVTRTEAIMDLTVPAEIPTAVVNESEFYQAQLVNSSKLNAMVRALLNDETKDNLEAIRIKMVDESQPNSVPHPTNPDAEIGSYGYVFEQGVLSVSVGFAELADDYLDENMFTDMALIFALSSFRDQEEVFGADINQFMAEFHQSNPGTVLEITRL